MESYTSPGAVRYTSQVCSNMDYCMDILEITVAYSLL